MRRRGLTPMACQGGVSHSAVDRGVVRQSTAAWGWCGERRLQQSSCMKISVWCRWLAWRFWVRLW